MILSQTATYALRAALCLAEAESDDPMRVDDIARLLGVPRNYLSKILHAMAKSGVLASTRGPGGGFRLSTSPDATTLAQIVEQFDDLPSASGCLLGREVCSDDDPCAAHERWKNVSVSVRRFFAETSVADLSRDRSLIDPGKGG